MINRIFFGFICFLLIGLAACQMPGGQGHRAEAEGLLFRLQSADKKQRAGAKDSLTSFLFLPRDLPLLKEAVSLPYPDDTLAENSTRSVLFRLMAGMGDTDMPAFIQTIYPDLPPNPEIKAEALATLTALPGRSSFTALGTFILDSGSDLSGQEDRVLAPLAENPDSLAYLFPALISMKLPGSFQFPALSLLSAGLQKNALSPVAISDSLHVLTVWFMKLKKDRALSKEGSDEFRNTSATLASLIDCLSYMSDNPYATAMVFEGLKDPDPRVRMAATLSRLERELPVPDSVMLNLAEDAGSRTQWFMELDRLGKSDLFPKKLLRAQTFAEGDFALWLQNSDWKHKPLDELEIFDRRDMQIGEDSLSFFLLRFRMGGSPWMVGISGPQPADSLAAVKAGDRPFAEVGYLTGSEFVQEDKKSLSAHWKTLLKDLPE